MITVGVWKRTIPADALVALVQRDGALKQDEDVAVAPDAGARGQVVGQALHVGRGALGWGGTGVRG